jgi:hypothetical protein
MNLFLANTVGASGQWRRRIRRPDGSATPFSPWRKNLILDGGLNLLPGLTWGMMPSHAMIGTGNRAVEKQTNGTGITLTQATNQVGASGNFFASTDVGAILKYGTNGTAGTEQSITAYTSPTLVTVSSSATVAPTDGTVWQVQQTALQTYLNGDNGTFEADVVTFSAAGTPHITFKRGYQFPAVVSNVTITEIGFGPNAGNVQPFSRVVVPGTGDALTPGQIYEVEYQLTVNLPGGAGPAGVTDVSGGAWNTSGNYMVESGLALSQKIGWPAAANSFDGAYDGVSLITANWSQRTLIANSSVAITGTIQDSGSQASYSAGTFQLSRTYTYNIGTVNGLVYGIGSCRANTSNAVEGWSIKFSTPVTKDNLHTLTLTSVLTFGRILSN